MDYMVSLHFIDFISWGVLDNGPIYAILYYTTRSHIIILGSVACPVIQATGRSEFEDGLGSGDFVSDYSYHMSVRTRLPDITKQTKSQNQQPSDVKNTCSS
jgi:hypothetical protein